MDFTAEIKLNGINPYVLVSKARAQALKSGWRKPMPVLVQVNGQPLTPWRINMMPRGDGSFYLYLHGDVRKASNSKVGDTVDVRLEFDPEYRSGPAHPIPEQLRTAFLSKPGALQAWKKLTPSRQKEILRYFGSLKSEEARNRNAERVLAVLSGAKARFMARDWADGK